MATNYAELEKRLWDSADALRANSELKASEVFGAGVGIDLPALC